MAATNKFIGIGLAAGAGYLLWSKLRPKTAEAAGQDAYEKSLEEGDTPAEAEAKAEGAAATVEAAQEPPMVFTDEEGLFLPAAETGPSISVSTPFETWAEQYQEASKLIAINTGATQIGIDSWAAYEKMPFGTKRAINMGPQGQQKFTMSSLLWRHPDNPRGEKQFTKKQIFNNFLREMSKWRSKAHGGRQLQRAREAHLTSQYGHLRPPDSGSPRSFTNWYVIQKKKMASLRGAHREQCGSDEDAGLKLNDPTLKMAWGGMHRLGWVATRSMGSGYNFKKVPEGGFGALQKVFDAIANRQYVMTCYEAA